MTEVRAERQTRVGIASISSEWEMELTSRASMTPIQDSRIFSSRAALISVVY